MNKGHFKDSQVVKGITIGAVLIVIYLALNNVTGILDSISYLAGLVMPFIIGAVMPSGRREPSSAMGTMSPTFWFCAPVTICSGASPPTST